MTLTTTVCGPEKMYLAARWHWVFYLVRMVGVPKMEANRGKTTKLFAAILRHPYITDTLPFTCCLLFLYNAQRICDSQDVLPAQWMFWNWKLCWLFNMNSELGDNSSCFVFCGGEGSLKIYTPASRYFYTYKHLTPTYSISPHCNQISPACCSIPVLYLVSESCISYTSFWGYA